MPGLLFAQQTKIELSEAYTIIIVKNNNSEVVNFSNELRANIRENPSHCSIIEEPEMLENKSLGDQTEGSVTVGHTGTIKIFWKATVRMMDLKMFL